MLGWENEASDDGDCLNIKWDDYDRMGSTETPIGRQLLGRSRRSRTAKPLPLRSVKSRYLKVWKITWKPRFSQYFPVICSKMAVCQNLVPLVNIKIAGKWMFIPLKMVLIGIDPYPNQDQAYSSILQLIFPAFSSVSPFFSGTSGEVIPPPTKKKQPTHPPSTSP